MLPIKLENNKSAGLWMVKACSYWVCFRCYMGHLMVTLDTYKGMKMEILVKSCRCEQETLRSDGMKYHLLTPFCYCRHNCSLCCKWSMESYKLNTDNILADTDSDLSELSRL